MLTSGSLLKERYVIEKHLGKGGMGSVYLATDRTFGSLVALKETIVHGGGLEEAFEREAHVLNKLRHGAIPVVMDYFIEGEGRFLVMQYIPGDDLSALIDRTRKPFSPDRVLEWADKLLDALTYMHTQDPPVVHRDIKPQNLKLTDREEIVLLDFGLSKSAMGGEAAQSVSIFGYTPSYAPIEQIQGEGTDARSDLYSLAATLYHLLTGIKPPDAIRRIAAPNDPLYPIHEMSPGVSRQVSDVLMSALAIRRENRPTTASEMRTALRGAAFDDLLSLARGFDTDSAGQAVGEGGSIPVDARSGAPVGSKPMGVGSSELPTLVGSAQGAAPDGFSMSATPDATLAFAPPSPELPTVVTPGPGSLPSGWAAPTTTPSPPPVAPAMPVPGDADLLTVVTPLGYTASAPLPSTAAPPEPPRIVRNTTLPSRVRFVFETATLGPDGQIEKREKRAAKNYFEDAGGGASISMVEIPKGTFALGSPEDEEEREESEGPVVEMTIGAFFVSRSPITQAQWRAVATSLPRVKLDLSPAPSQFTGDDRPVEMVSWEEAKEFCERLAAHTGREYRLAGEAEWEYACRAGSATPFGFGSTLTVEVANVDGAIGYGEGPSGDGRSETTPVESLGLANRFGLYEMHGNVWEWTEDRWHDTLDGIPADGAPWVEGGDPTVRVVRGGSWASIPADARSAKRFSFLQSGRRNDVGFRVVMARIGAR
jgi:formylglycine-generating enzyme required for sulfatase activity/serine/threonine protein kinase